LAAEAREGERKIIKSPSNSRSLNEMIYNCEKNSQIIKKNKEILSIIKNCSEFRHSSLIK